MDEAVERVSSTMVEAEVEVEVEVEAVVVVDGVVEEAQESVMSVSANEDG
jgi:hypothetical protein